MRRDHALEELARLHPALDRVVAQVIPTQVDVLDRLRIAELRIEAGRLTHDELDLG